MNISEEKIQKITNDIIEELLKAGIYPSFTEVNKKLNEILTVEKDNISFKPIKAIEHAVTSSKDYNKMFSSLYKDIEFAYNLNFKLTKKLSEFYENIYVETEKIYKELEKINIRKKSIDEVTSKNSYSESKIINFDNFYDIELDGDTENNIPETTAFIDLNTKTVYNKNLPNIIKYDLNNANISIQSNYGTGETVNNNIENILNDNFDENFIYKVTSDNNKNSNITLNVILKDKLSCNFISLDYISSYNISAFLSISDDENIYTDIKKIKGQNLSEWNFPLQTIKAFKITIEKSLPEEENLDTSVYYYIINNISLYNKAYNNKNILVTKPINYNSVISMATLKAEEEKDYGTNIEYFLGTINENNKVAWFPIENNVPIKLNTLKSERKIVNSQRFDENSNLLKLYTLKPNYKHGSLKIYPGYQMWKKEVFTLKKNIQYIPLITDCKMENLISKSYVSCDENSFYLKGYTLLVMSQYIYSEDEYTSQNKYIKSKNGYQITSRVFINNNEVKSADNQYTLKLKKGKNKITIFIYCPSLTSNDEELDHEIIHNFNLKDISFNIFSEYKIKLINKDALLNKPVSSTLKYFAVDDNNNVLINNNESNTNLKFLITYDYIEKNKLNKDKTIRIMAILNTLKSDVTPRISSIKLTVE